MIARRACVGLVLGPKLVDADFDLAVDGFDRLVDGEAGRWIKHVNPRLILSWCKSIRDVEGRPRATKLYFMPGWYRRADADRVIELAKAKGFSFHALCGASLPPAHLGQAK